jgi:hypothetical protein
VTYRAAAAPPYPDTAGTTAGLRGRLRIIALADGAHPDCRLRVWSTTPSTSHDEIFNRATLLSTAMGAGVTLTGLLLLRRPLRAQRDAAPQAAASGTSDEATFDAAGRSAV